MIKVEVTEKFTLERFDKIKNLIRKGTDIKGKLYVGDTFECDSEMAEYLTGKNALKKVVVKIIEVIPEAEEKKEAHEEPDKELTTNVKHEKKNKKNKKNSG